MDISAMGEQHADDTGFIATVQCLALEIWAMNGLEIMLIVVCASP